jgi:hypothetical protein
MVVRTVMVTVQPTHNDAVHVSAVARSAYGTMPHGSVPAGHAQVPVRPPLVRKVPAGAGDDGGDGGW